NIVEGGGDVRALIVGTVDRGHFEEAAGRDRNALERQAIGLLHLGDAALQIGILLGQRGDRGGVGRVARLDRGGGRRGGGGEAGGGRGLFGELLAQVGDFGTELRDLLADAAVGAGPAPRGAA